MTAAITATRMTTPPESAASAALLTYLGELLGATDRPAAPDVLHALARLFGARGAGIAHLSDATVHSDAAAWINGDPPTVLTWQDDVAALRHLADRGEPAPLEDDGGSWLVWFDDRPSPDGPAVLWLNAVESRRWTAYDGAALALAGRTLWRLGMLGRLPELPAEERLAQGAVVASRLSHDFGNVLTGVMGFTELALGQVAAGTRAQAYLQEVWDVTGSGADWLKKLNYFCRRNPPEFTPTGLPGALAEEEARLGNAVAPAWHADIPADLPALACDGESLRVALREVLNNAREATAAREPPQLAARAAELSAPEAQALLGRPQAGRYVEIAVSDRGPGIREDIRARLFKEWFFSSKPRHRGMGLMMAYGIVRRFGGGLAVGPGAEGGTQVRLYFPAAPDPVPGGPAQLLVVDDDPQVLADARRILEPAGYRVVVAGSAAEAVVLHQTAASPFDLVLIAGRLPNLSGAELARRMLLRDPHAHFLFLHTPAGPSLPRDALVSADTLVHKPIAGPALLQTVAAALRRCRRGPGPAD